MKEILKNIKNIVWLCRPYWKYCKWYFLLSISVPVLLAPVNDVIYVRFPERIVDLLTNGKSYSYVITYASVICAVSFLTYLIPCFFYCYFQRKNVYVDLKVKRDIYKKAMAVDFKYIDSPEYYNQYSWALNEYANQTKAARDFLQNFLQYFLSITVLLSIIAATGPWILLFEAIQLFFHAKINLKENGVEIKKKDELIPVQRRLSYIHRLFYLKEYSTDIRTTKLSKIILKRYDKTGENNIHIVNQYARKILFWGILHEILFCATEFTVIVYLIYNISIGNIVEVGLYITMMLAFYRVDSKLQNFIKLIRTANELSLNAEKIQNFFNIESEIEADNSKIKELPDGNAFSVELQNVNFQYEESDFSLSDITLQIKPGEKIAIVGENGAGKSTFLKLLLRLYDVSSGQIKINNRSIGNYAVHSLREKIGVAFQNPNIYAMTFSENLSLYNAITDTECNEIFTKLGINSILEKNNATLDVELTKEFDKNGLMLSGGEIQKVALARIMTGDFGLLLLDEPSSALDPIAEHEMNELILSAANKTTTIMVAHRLSSTRNADRIILIDHGHIKETGTHDELMSLHGKYFEMFTKQAENYVK